MTAKRSIVLTCDSDTIGVHQVFMGLYGKNVQETRVSASFKGWTRRRGKGKIEDICPACNKDKT